MRSAALVLACFACAGHVRRTQAIQQALETPHEEHQGSQASRVRRLESFTQHTSRTERILNPAKVLAGYFLAFDLAGSSNLCRARGQSVKGVHGSTAGRHRFWAARFKGHQGLPPLAASRRWRSVPRLCASGSESSTAVASPDSAWQRNLRLIEAFAEEYYGPSTDAEDGAPKANIEPEKFSTATPVQEEITRAAPSFGAQESSPTTTPATTTGATGMDVPQTTPGMTAPGTQEMNVPVPSATATAIASAVAPGTETSSNRWLQAIELLSEIRMAGMTPDLASYSAAILVCEKENQWELVLSLLGEMRLDGVNPDVPCLSAAISACQRAGKWERLLPLRQEMRILSGEMVTAPDVEKMEFGDLSGEALSAPSFSEASSAAEEVGQEQDTKPQGDIFEQEPQAAQPQFEEMPAAGTRFGTEDYPDAIAASDKDGNWQRVLFLFEKMRSAGVTPDVSSFTAAIAACQKGGQWQQKVSLLEEANLRGVAMKVTAALEERQESEDNGVEDLMSEEINDDKSNSLPAGSEQMQVQSEVTDSKQMQAEVEKAAESVVQDISIYNAGLLACEKSGDWERVLSLLDEMRQARIKPNLVSYSAAILACENGGQPQQAAALFEETSIRDWAMMVLGREVDEERETLNMPILNAETSPSEDGEKWQQMLSLLQEIRQAGKIPDLTSFSAAISACEEGNQWQHALALLEEMQTVSVPPDVASFQATINACERAGHWLEAVSVMEQMDRKGLTMAVR